MNDSSQQPEKRITKRVAPSRDQPVHINVEGVASEEAITAVNVSKEGMGLLLPEGFEGCDLDEVTVILVKLPEPVNHSFSTTVKIVHRQGNKCGVRFADLVKEDEESLSGYIEYRLVNTDGASLMKMLYGG